MRSNLDQFEGGSKWTSRALPKPWRRLKPNPNAGGYLSYYYSDDLSPLPVRAVTRIRDNKTDPNLETGTYGLFSTCSKSMRKSVVANGSEYIIFMTSRITRVICGYYRIGWTAPTLFSDGDFCLAAAQLHFIAEPLSFESLRKPLGLRKARCCLRLSPTQVNGLVDRLNEQPDATARYVREIRRLEQFNFSRTGKRYVNFGWITSPDWDRGTAILERARRQGGSVVTSNRSSTGEWRCLECGFEFESGSLLKCCPSCDHIGSVQPRKPI